MGWLTEGKGDGWGGVKCTLPMFGLFFFFWNIGVVVIGKEWSA